MTDNQIMQKIDEGVNMGRNFALLGLKLEILEMKSHIKGESNDYDEGESNDYDEGFINALDMVLEAIKEREIL